MRFTILRALPCLALLAITTSVRVSAQAQAGILALSVRHTTLKNTTKPSGELKSQIDSLDALIGAAARVGRTAELRRLYAQSAVLLAGQPWTPESEFGASVVMRTERQVVDPARPWTVRVEQIFAPGIRLERTLVARASLKQRPSNAAPGTALNIVRELGRFDGVPRDLRDTPFVIDADLTGVNDGNYIMSVELLDSARTLSTANIGIVVRNGLDATVTKLEAAAEKAAEPLRSDLRFPIDRLRQVNASRVALGTFNAARDFAAAESLLAPLAARKDPWATRRGDIKRHYLLTAANEIMPYRMYVPTTYSSKKSLPLVIALHGLGGTEDAFFTAYGAVLPKLAEERGYIVAAPLGYRVDGAYGVALGSPSGDPAAARNRALSEEDVLQVVEAVCRQYNIDPQRVYLMGHSMGAIGTWALAAKYPDRWTGLGVFSGFGLASSARTIAHIPQFVVHGDADPTVTVGGSRTMVAALKAANANVRYLEIPGGNHNDVVEPNLSAMFEFFDAYPRRGTVAP